MEHERKWVTFGQVRSNQIVTFDRPEEGFRQPVWRKPPARKGYSGGITKSTAKRIKTAVDIFLQMSEVRDVYNPVLKKNVKFQLSFITLTIAQQEQVKIEEGHAALKVWLQHFKKPWRKSISEEMKTYLWKCELQKRGQLHYHITTNSFLHFAEIRRVWNDLQRRRGWLDEYHTKKGHWDANSTDVHSVYKVKNIERYLSKYLAKDDPSQKLDSGKLWGCSNDLRGKKRFTFEMDEFTWKRIEEGTQSGEVRLYKCDHAKFYERAAAKELLGKSQRFEYEMWKDEL